MSAKAKNIIAIVIAAVAILAVAAVVVLSSIVVRPTAYAGGWLDNVTAVEIYHSSAEGNLLHSGAIASELNEGTGEYADDGYTAGDLLDESGFSLIAACLQFNYSFGLSLADGDNAENNKMSRTEMSARHTELTTGAESARGYSVVRQFVGHGVGAGLHESPEVPNFGTPGRGVRLLPGMTIAIEPMINAGVKEVTVLKDGVSHSLTRE